jgi:Ca2+-binding EF-hand superfamily protein
MLARSALVIFLMTALSAEAQQSVADPLVDDLRADQTMAQFVGSVQSNFTRLARKQAEITLPMLSARAKANAATQRSLVLSMVMRYDLNGDLKVTKPEIAEANLGGYDSRDNAEMIDPFDSNKNGVVELKELVAAMMAKQITPDRETEKFRALVVSAGGADGALDRNEITMAAERTFNAADSDKSGVLERAEFEAARPNLRRFPSVRRPMQP